MSYEAQQTLSQRLCFLILNALGTRRLVIRDAVEREQDERTRNQHDDVEDEQLLLCKYDE